MSIYQHFREEEQPFIDQVLSWKEMVERTYQPKLTDFLDPRQCRIINTLIPDTEHELKVLEYGGGKDTERKRVLIAPYYETVVENDFNLSLIETTFPEKFVTISHKDVLGAFLSLGIVRDKLGDIVIIDGTVQLVIAQEIALFVKMNLTQIKRATVKFYEKPLSERIQSVEQWIKSTATVTSLRLDNVVKEIYNISRKDARQAILKQLVKVNFKTIDDAKFLLEEGDLISFRGKGRSKLVEILGETRKGKTRIITARLN
ncbi:MAG TPA: YlmH/Sll1252 family protein [Cerasibacillus sp.]|uniref:YlmH family RNA-binding protein n=1 Tax=Cerasibacillus sp. TaxID=2498711 RepID=UPI002F3E29C0